MRHIDSEKIIHLLHMFKAAHFERMCKPLCTKKNSECPTELASDEWFLVLLEDVSLGNSLRLTLASPFLHTDDGESHMWRDAAGNTYFSAYRKDKSPVSHERVIAFAPAPLKPDPCPFCGTVDNTELQQGEEGGALQFRLVCRTCQTTGPVGTSESSAIEFWNERKKPRQ